MIGRYTTVIFDFDEIWFVIGGSLGFDSSFEIHSTRN